MAPVAVAPAFAHTAMGFSPAARSSATMRASASRSMRERPSLGTMRARSGWMPEIFAALYCAGWVWSLMYTAARSG